MPAPIVPPQLIHYSGSINPLPVGNTKPPPEGYKTVPISIQWATDGVTGGINGAVAVNLQSQQVVSLSKINSIYVDNTSCAYTVRCFFQDTQFVVDVPPGACCLQPVFTNQLNITFWLMDLTAASPLIVPVQLSDVTYINVLNHAPDIANFVPLFQDQKLIPFMSTISFNFTGPGTFFSAPIAGAAVEQEIFIQSINVNLSTAPIPTGQDVVVSLVDDVTHGTIYWQRGIINLSGASLAITGQDIINMSGLKISTNDGVSFGSSIGVVLQVAITPAINVQGFSNVGLLFTN